jgi:hypothetical protein
MVQKADTGLGATLVLGTQAWAAKIRMIGEIEESIEDQDVSTLDTVAVKEYEADDLSEPGEFDVEALFPTGIALPQLGNVVVPETITITYPLRTGESTAANHAGSGYIKSRTWPELKPGGLQLCKLKIRFDGFTGPTFTPSVASGG